MLNYLKVFSGFQTFGLFDFWKMMSKRKLSCWFIVSGSYVVWGGVHPWKLTWNTQKLVVCIDVSPFPRGYVQVSCWFFGCVSCYMLVSLYISGRRFSSILHQGNLMLDLHKRNLLSIMFFLFNSKYYTCIIIEFHYFTSSMFSDVLLKFPFSK